MFGMWRYRSPGVETTLKKSSVGLMIASDIAALESRSLCFRSSSISKSGFPKPNDRCEMAIQNHDTSHISEANDRSMELDGMRIC